MRRKTTCKKVLRAIAFAIAMMIAVACTPVRAFATSENNTPPEFAGQQGGEQQGGEAQQAQNDPNGQGQSGSETQEVQTQVEATVAIVDGILDDINTTGTNNSNIGLNDLAWRVYQNIPESEEAFGYARTTQQNVAETKASLESLKRGLEANNNAVSRADTITGSLNTVNDFVELDPSETDSDNLKTFEYVDERGNRTTIKCVNGFGDKASSFNENINLANEYLQYAQTSTSNTNAVNHAIEAKNYLGSAATALTAANSLITSAETEISKAKTYLSHANSAFSREIQKTTLFEMNVILTNSKDYALNAKNAAVSTKNSISDSDQSLVDDVDLVKSKTEDLYDTISHLKVSSAPGGAALEAVDQKLIGLEGNISWAKKCLAIMQERYDTLNSALTNTGLLPVEPDPEPDPPVNNGANTATNDPVELNPDESGSGTNDPVQINTGESGSGTNDPVQINTDDTKGTSGTTVDVKTDDSGKAKGSSVKVSTADEGSKTVTTTTVNSGTTVTSSTSNTSDLLKAEVVGTVKLDDSVSVEAADQASDSAEIISEEAAVAVAKADAASIVAEETPVADNEVISAPTESQDKKPVSAGAVAGAGAATCAVGGSAFAGLKWIRRRKLF